MFVRIFERLFVIVLLLCSMKVVLGLSNPSISEDTTEDMVSVELDATVRQGVYMCGALLVLLRWRRVLRAARTVWPLMALGVLAPLSMVWSVQPVPQTFHRGVTFLAATVVSIYLGERYSLDELARVVTKALCLMMLTVIALSFVAPAYVIEYSDHLGAWKGLSIHKNYFGEYMAVAVILLLLVRFRHFDRLRYVFLVAATALLVLSRSAASLGFCLLMVAAIPLWRWARLKRKQRLLVCVLTIPTMLWAMYFIAGNVGGLIRLLGRDPTLTGRTRIWAMVWASLMKRPILGYGFDAFWLGLKGESARILGGLGWVIPHSHNGFLDLGLNLGAVGFAVYLCLWIFSFRKAIRFIRLEQRAIGLLPVTYLCFFALHNLFESSLLASDSLSLLLFAMITTSVAVHSRQYSGATQNSDTQQLVEEWHGSRALTPVRCDARLGSWG